MLKQGHKECIYKLRSDDTEKRRNRVSFGFFVLLVLYIVSAVILLKPVEASAAWHENIDDSTTEYMLIVGEAGAGPTTMDETRYISQKIVAGATVEISGIRIPIERISGTALNFDGGIYLYNDSFPGPDTTTQTYTGSALATFNYNIAGISSDPADLTQPSTWTQINFASPYTLTEGEQYVFLLYDGGTPPGYNYFPLSNDTYDGIDDTFLMKAQSNVCTTAYWADNVTDASGGSPCLGADKSSYDMMFQLVGDFYDYTGITNEILVASATGSDITVSGTCPMYYLEEEGTFFVAQDSDPAVPGTDGVTDWDSAVPAEVFVWAYRTDDYQVETIYEQGVLCDEETGEWSHEFEDLAEGSWSFKSSACVNRGFHQCVEDWLTYQHYATGGTTGLSYIPQEQLQFGNALETGLCEDASDLGALVDGFCTLYDGIIARPPFVWLGQIMGAFQQGWNLEESPLDLTFEDPNEVLEDIIIFDSTDDTVGLPGLIGDTFADTWNEIFMMVFYIAFGIYLIRTPARFLRAFDTDSSTPDK